jgi:hypothetical protein
MKRERASEGFCCGKGHVVFIHNGIRFKYEEE